MAKHADSNAAKIRTMLAEGLTPTEVAAILNVSRQYVYGVQYYDRHKEKAKAAPAPKRGRPKGSKNKPKVERAKPLLLVQKDVLQRLQEENIYMAKRLAAMESEPPKVVEVPVPQPFPNYTFWQRLRYLFTGSHA